MSGGQTETAEAARIRFAGQNSKLAGVISNVEAGFMKALEFATEFMGGSPGQIEFTINREFYDSELNPQMVMATIQLQDRGVIGKTDTREMLRRANMLTRPDEEIELEAEQDVLD